MKKYFCDRCGAEIGEENDVERWVNYWKVCGNWCKSTRDLCKKCSDEMLDLLDRRPQEPFISEEPANQEV